MLPLESSLSDLPEPEDVRDILERVAEHGLPGPLAATILDVGSEAYLEFFQSELLEGLANQGGSTCRFFEGAHGSGKTHLLLLLHDLALRRGMAVVRTDLSQALSLEDWRLITGHILQNIEAKVNGQVVRSLPEVLGALHRSGRAKTAALRKATLPHTGFQTAMYLVAGGLSDRDILNQYLLGGRVGVGQLRRQGIAGVKNPLTARNAEQVLNTVLSGLFALGLSGTLLLFDENEQTFEQRGHTPSRRTVMSANLMRRFIDACNTGGLVGTVAVFAVLNSFIDNCSRAYPALGQRLETTRGNGHQAAWRWPVLPVHTINSISEPEEFLDRVIGRFMKLISHCGGNCGGLEEEMRSRGLRVLDQNAGTGYRRDLMKVLATVSLKRI